MCLALGRGEAVVITSSYKLASYPQVNIRCSGTALPRLVDLRPSLLLPLLSLSVPEGMHYTQQVLSGKHLVTGTCTKCSGSLVPDILGVVPAGLLWPPLRFRGPLPPSLGLSGPENTGMSKG